MKRRSDGERGDWSYIASFSFALALMAALALAVDGEAIAYARARLWAVTTSAARAGARCLAPAPAPTTTEPAAACADQTVGRLVSEDLAATALQPVSVTTALPAADSVAVEITASLILPFRLPGTANPIDLSDRATATLLPAPS